MTLAQRQLEGELMDDPALDASAHAAALRGLQRINLVSRTTANVWKEAARIVADRDSPASLLDVACGGGDVAVALARRARRGGFALKVHACDISPVAIENASALALRARAPVNFFRADALRDPLPAHYTIITATLFLHHLSDEQIVAQLRKLAAHADHLLISDLVRGPLGYMLAWFGTQLLSRSHIVHEDGLRSVRAALSLHEARALADAAGLHDARFERRWPRRFLMIWSRAPSGNAHA